MIRYRNTTKSIINILIPLCLGIMFRCTDPGGLDTTAGVKGTVIFESEWPDSIKAAVVVVFDVDLDLDSLESSEYSIVDHFITFSDPLGAGSDEEDYFIQLEPAGYLLMILGLLAEPAELMANEEIFQQIQNYIVVPENLIPRGIIIRDGQINEQIAWSVSF